ncbi:MAG TPA: hypothetical protein PKB10_10330, partial [Tepidisphaeraceae bacterium]|nr:hypothetical protein [Tepidisphaeraceae bacterium]
MQSSRRGGFDDTRCTGNPNLRNDLGQNQRLRPCIRSAEVDTQQTGQYPVGLGTVLEQNERLDAVTARAGHRHAEDLHFADEG